MKNHISEELPARKHPQSSLSVKSKSNDGESDREEKTPEARVRQAKYDIRYRARREGIPLRQAYSQYMQNSSMSESEKMEVRKALFSEGGVQAEDFNIDQLASTSVANALFKVFVEGNSKDYSEDSGEYIEELKAHLNKYNNSENKKYKVRVTDKNGVSYVRYADRQKISELRSNPNIDSVEMTEYGTPYEGERSKGERTAAAKSGKDYDGDKKVESGAKEYRGAVHNAIQRKKGGTPDGKDTSSVKEEFIGEVVKEKKNPKDATINVMKGTNRKVINLSPKMGISEDSYSKFLNKVRNLNEKAESEQQQKLFGLALSVKRGKTSRSEVSAEVLKIVDTMSEKKIRDFAKTKHEGLPVHKEETACDSPEPQRDTRGDYAKKEVIKNKIRSGLGIKNPIVMISDEGEVKEGVVADLVGKLNANPRTSAKQGAENFTNNIENPIKSAIRKVLQPANMSRAAQDARRNKYRPEEFELKGEIVDEAAKKIRGRSQPGTTKFSDSGYYGRTAKEKKDPKKMKPIFPGPKSEKDSGDNYGDSALTASERNPNLR